LYNAVLSPPTCKAPVGLGANLTRTLILFFVKDNIKRYPNEIICFFFVLYLQKKA
jgi:hypothetical protein